MAGWFETKVGRRNICVELAIPACFSKTAVVIHVWM